MKNVTQDMTGHWLLVQGSEALCVSAVNCFIMISGFFMTETNDRRLKKVASLFGRTIGYSILLYVVCIFAGLDQNSLSLFLIRTIPTNYFVALYSVLYLISPLINLALERLDDEKFKTVLTMLFVLFSVWPTVVDLLCDLTQWWPMGVSPVAMQGNDQGYTITNFCLSYSIGAYIRRRYKQKEMHERVSQRRYTYMYICASVLLVFESLFTSTTFYYSNVLVFISAAALLQAFLYCTPLCRQETKAPLQRPKITRIKAVKKSFVFLGKHSLDVFLIHTNPLMLVYFWNRFSIPERFAQLHFLKAFLFALTAIGSMYCLCIIVMIVYHFFIEKTVAILMMSPKDEK